VTGVQTCALPIFFAELKEADRKKTEFLAVLSHELRNPLAPIRNAIALLDRAPAESAAARRAKEILHRQAEHLSRLVDDLLDLSRIAHGKMHVELAPTEVRELVRRAYLDARVQFEARQVGLALIEPAEALWVEADAARFAQMLGNLLHNALKFTPPGGLVRLEVARRGDACEVAVKDSGQGLDPADLERIFDPFEQAAPSRDGVGGLGLGLALVRRLALKHHGTVRARSDGPGRGAEFVLELPLVAAPAVASASGAPGANLGTAPLSILVVEDNEDAAATLADLLSLGGHRLRIACSGGTGVSLTASERPDVVICDVGLPDMSGYEVIRRVRASEHGRRVFAVAMTGYAQPQDREEALAAGFDAHLAKPPPLAELEVLLERAARRQGA
jgi:CheY-like chemotaxis protein/two-component sensor histidine kinase